MSVRELRFLRVHTACAGMLVALSLALSACASLDLPTEEEARKTIERNAPLLGRAEQAIRLYEERNPSGSDFVMRTRATALNRLFGALAGNRSDDIRIFFPPTRPFYSEKKSTLGIEYENLLNIDTGSVVMNLRTLRIERLDRNRVDARLVIEGEGTLAVSGRYLGIPARTSPDVGGRLDEVIAFDALPSRDGGIILRPVDRTVTLRLTFTVTLLEWRVPWTQDVQLRVSDLIKPVEIPVAMQTELPLPVPAEQPGGEQFVRVPHVLEMLRGMVTASRGILEFRSDLEIRKKGTP